MNVFVVVFIENVFCPFNICNGVLKNSNFFTTSKWENHVTKPKGILYRPYVDFHQAPGSRNRRRSSRLARKILGERNDGTNQTNVFSQTTLSSNCNANPLGGDISLASTGSYQDFAVCTFVVFSLPFLVFHFTR